MYRLITKPGSSANSGPGFSMFFVPWFLINVLKTVVASWFCCFVSKQEWSQHDRNWFIDHLIIGIEIFCKCGCQAREQSLSKYIYHISHVSTCDLDKNARCTTALLKTLRCRPLNHFGKLWKHSAEVLHQRSANCCCCRPQWRRKPLVPLRLLLAEPKSL